MVRVRGLTGIILVVPDGTGLTSSACGNWTHHKYEIKRDSMRLSIMISQETPEILAFRVIGERTGDSPQLECLLNDTLNNLRIDFGEHLRQAKTAKTGCPPSRRLRRCLQMGRYDTRKIFQICRSDVDHVRRPSRSRTTSRTRPVSDTGQNRF